MKKVLFILHLPPPVHGSSVVGQFIKESRRINETFNARYINLGTSRSVDEIGRNPLGKIGRYLSIIWQCLVHLVKFQPDLCCLAITAKGPAFFKDTLLALLVKLFRVRLIYHFHNKGVRTCEHRVFYDRCYRFVFRNSQAILLSQYLYPDIQKYFPENRVHYCPNGIPEESCQKTDAGGQRSKDGLVEIFFLSNLLEAKGVLVLLEACRQLKNSSLPFHCKFVGGDADLTVEQCGQKVSELGLTRQVEFVGKKYGNEKAQAFSHADIFAFPTHYHNECFPLVLLEAMQHGLPVVSTFEGGIADIVEEGVTGFLVPQNDTQALADQLAALIRDRSLRERFGLAGYNRYKEKFTLEIFEQKMASILMQVATGC